jgi:hypothetical protein
MIKTILTGIIASTALLAVPAQAQHYGHHNPYGPRVQHHGHHRGGGWIAPLIIGGVVGAAIANNRDRDTVIVQEQPVIIRQQQPVYVQTPQTVCTAWKEIQNSDGTIYRERTCYQQ